MEEGSTAERVGEEEQDGADVDLGGSPQFPLPRCTRWGAILLQTGVLQRCPFSPTKQTQKAVQLGRRVWVQFKPQWFLEILFPRCTGWGTILFKQGSSRGVP